MRYGHPLVCAGLVATTLLLVSCGRGNSVDVFPWAALTMSPTSGPDSFLLFPNPQKQDDGSLQTNTSAYATAYYEAIDPINTKDTLDKWKAANGFGNSTTGTETTVVFGDVKDLGYGRRITARKNNDGTIAVVVENYLVSAAADYTYSSLNLDAAIVRDPRWHVGTNGIEFSSATCTPQSDPTTCDPTVKFAKFYTFDPTTGQRVLVADLDGRGDKAMPGICITCHGGRGDPLTPATGSPTTKALFPLVGNSASQKRGDVQAHLQPLDVDSFGYSTTSGYTRADQEAALKTFNKLVLGSYPIVAAPVFPEDASRRVAIPGEWPGTAAAIIKSAYGGDGLPNATFSDTYVPVGWSSLGQTSLYKNVVVPACRTCHIQRGTNAMNDIDFDNYCAQTTPGVCDPAALNSYFFGYADRTKAHVIDRGNMPLAKIVYERFWSTGEADTLATFLQSAQTQAVRDSGGAVLKPGRPVADPGPDRTTDSPATLSAANSLYATTYAWSIVASPTGAAYTLSNANSAQASLSGTNGAYVLQLVVGNSTTQSPPVQVNVTIAAVGTLPLPKAAGAIRFADIKAFIQGNPPGCTGCHSPGGGTPIFFTNNIDRNGDGTIGDATDDLWFYTELRGQINFTDVAASPLLRKPTGHHHGGGLSINTASPAACTGSCVGYTNLGDYYKAYYNMIVLWILNGAPYI